MQHLGLHQLQAYPAAVTVDLYHGQQLLASQVQASLLYNHVHGAYSLGKVMAHTRSLSTRVRLLAMGRPAEGSLALLLGRMKQGVMAAQSQAPPQAPPPSGKLPERLSTAQIEAEAEAAPAAAAAAAGISCQELQRWADNLCPGGWCPCSAAATIGRLYLPTPAARQLGLHQLPAYPAELAAMVFLPDKLLARVENAKLTRRLLPVGRYQYFLSSCRGTMTESQSCRCDSSRLVGLGLGAQGELVVLLAPGSAGAAGSSSSSAAALRKALLAGGADGSTTAPKCAAAAGKAVQVAPAGSSKPSPQVAVQAAKVAGSSKGRRPPLPLRPAAAQASQAAPARQKPDAAAPEAPAAPAALPSPAQLQAWAQSCKLQQWAACSSSVGNAVHSVYIPKAAVRTLDLLQLAGSKVHVDVYINGRLQASVSDAKVYYKESCDNLMLRPQLGKLVAGYQHVLVAMGRAAGGRLVVYLVRGGAQRRQGQQKQKQKRQQQQQQQQQRQATPGGCKPGAGIEAVYARCCYCCSQYLVW